MNKKRHRTASVLVPVPKSELGVSEAEEEAEATEPAAQEPEPEPEPEPILTAAELTEPTGTTRPRSLVLLRKWHARMAGAERRMQVLQRRWDKKQITYHQTEKNVQAVWELGRPKCSAVPHLSIPPLGVGIVGRHLLGSPLALPRCEMYG